MKRVLFIDDEPDVRQFVKHVLTSSGYEVELAEDGEVGLEKLQQSRPDLILLDIMMPRHDGWSVLERLPEIPDVPPVILLTARDDVGSFARAFQMGVAAFINKPFRLAELIDTCERVLAASDAPVEEERRSEERQRVGLAVRVLSDAGIPLAMGEMQELSPSGARVKLAVPREVGCGLWLTLFMSSGETALQLFGTVRWCREEGDAYLLGIALGELGAETRENMDELFGTPADRS